MYKVDIEKLNRKNFRAMMNALSMPGSVQKITPLYDDATLAIASVLLYHEVSYFIQGTIDLSLISDISNPKATSLEMADYIFSETIDPALLEGAKKGTFLNPDFSAMLIFCAEENNQTKVRLSGPGINKIKEQILPCSPEFLTTLKLKNDNFPLGVEIFFIQPKNKIMALSRTTEIEVM